MQESLSNVARHARVSQVEVELTCEAEVIILSVRDNRVGFDAEQSGQAGGHLGLLSMKERVRLAKGTLDVEPVPSHGINIRVVIPSAQGATYA